MRHGLYALIEKLLRWCIHPRLRAWTLKRLGASIGGDVRISEVQLFNLSQGFKHLHIANHAHIGPGCRLDLEGELKIGLNTTLSPGVTILTHADPGSSHGSEILALYPARIRPVTIGNNCWLGANVTILDGVRIGDRTVVAAGSVVTKDAPAGVLIAGVPAQVKKRLFPSAPHELP